MLVSGRLFKAQTFGDRLETPFVKPRRSRIPCFPFLAKRPKMAGEIHGLLAELWGSR